MDSSDFKQHYSQQFNTELEEVRSRVLIMGGLVEQQLRLAIDALNRAQSHPAETVVSNDIKVNTYDVEIDERCTQILALRKPSASDLRLVLAVIKMTADLERIGDEAKRIAQMSLTASNGEARRNRFGQIAHLGSLVQGMLYRALDAFARMDVDAAIAVAHEDNDIDREYESIMRQSITLMMEDPRSVPSVMDVIWAARALERIGDRCCNISEYIIYFVKGKDVRHTSLEQIRKEFS